MLRLTIGLTMAASLASCAPLSDHQLLPSGNAGRLMQINDAKLARQHAPIFTKQALHTIVDLEKEIQLKELQVKQLTEKE